MYKLNSSEKTHQRRLQNISAHLTSAQIVQKQGNLNYLDELRSRSTLKSDKELINIFYGKYYEFRQKIYEFMVNDPDFRHHTTLELDREQQRYLGMRQAVKIIKNFSQTVEKYKKEPSLTRIIQEVAHSFDQALATKIGVHLSLYCKSLSSLGTQRHQYLLERALKLEDCGCLGLTELGHGSNVRNILTTAHFDKKTDEFIINTPCDLAMKFWIGGAAKTANITIIYAQLYVEDQCHGVHAFVVPLRDLRDHTLLPGVTIGDCGKKMGCDLIDNGFIIFDNKRIPRENLLNRLSSVNEKGEFVTQIENIDQRFALSFGALSGGRVQISSYCLTYLKNALTIGLRYSAQRRQFGPSNQQETAIINYPLTQYRIIPYVSLLFVNWIGANQLNDLWDSNQSIIFEGKNPLLAEMHALSSALKPLNTWVTQKGLQEMREVCAGLGYSAYNRLGAYIDDNNVQVTWEGDNNVLVTQAAKYIQSIYKKVLKGSNHQSQSLSFLNTNTTFKQIDAKDLFDINTVKILIEYRVSHLIKISFSKLIENTKKYNNNSLDAWNATLPFYFKSLVLAYGETYCGNEFYKSLQNCQDQDLKKIFEKLYLLWGFNIIEKDFGIFTVNNLLQESYLKLIREQIIELCYQLTPDSYRLIDIIAIPDILLGAPIGASDGDMYKRFLTAVRTAPGCFERPVWWKELKGLN